MGKPTITIIRKPTKDEAAYQLYLQYTQFRTPSKFSLKIRIKASEWNPTPKGFTRNRSVNYELNKALTKAEKIIETFEQRKQKLTFQIFKEAYRKTDYWGERSDEQLYVFWKEQNQKKLDLGEIKQTTFNQRESHRKVWIKFKKKLDFHEITTSVLDKFVIFCRKKGKMDSTIFAHLGAINGIVKEALKHKIIEDNPISEYCGNFNKHIRKQSKEKKESLSIEERDKMLKWYLENGDTLIPKMKERLRIFIIMCYTGLSYGDMQNVTYKDIQEIRYKGKNWKVFYNNRKKSNSLYKSVIRPHIEGIIYEKFIDGVTDLSDKIFEKLDLSYFNRSLTKLLAPIGITKKVTSHSGRHTFGMLALEEGIGTDTLQDMFGHGSPQQTNIYAKRSVLGVVTNAAETWQKNRYDIKNYNSLDFDEEKQILKNIIRHRKGLNMTVNAFYEKYAPQKQVTAVIEQFDTKGYNFTLSIIEAIGIARNLEIPFLDLVSGKNISNPLE